MRWWGARLEPHSELPSIDQVTARRLRSGRETTRAPGLRSRNPVVLRTAGYCVEAPSGKLLVGGRLLLRSADVSRYNRMLGHLCDIWHGPTLQRVLRGIRDGQVRGVMLSPPSATKSTIRPLSSSKRAAGRIGTSQRTRTSRVGISAV